MSAAPVYVFSSVRMEYVRKMARLTDRQVLTVCSLSEEEYRRLAGGGRRGRLWLRFVMYVTYPLRVFWTALRAPAGACLVVSSNTFYAPLVAWLGSRRCRPLLVHWRCDLYPDALVVAGTIRPGGFLESVIGRVQRLMTRTADRLVCVGDFLQAHAAERWGRPRWCRYIDNVPSDETQFARRAWAVRPGLGFHYGGQLGFMHDPDSLAAFVGAAHAVGGGHWRFDFRVSGAFRERFGQAVGALGLELRRPVSAADWKVLIEDYEIGLVSLSPGGATVSLPSKLYSMMAGGLAIVAVCPAWSDLARIVRDTGCGWIINNSPFATAAELRGGDYAANCQARRDLAEVTAESRALCQRLHADPALVAAAQRRAVAAAHATYGLEALRELWADVLAPRPQVDAGPAVLSQSPPP